VNAARVLETLAAAGVSVRRAGDRLKLKSASTGTIPADLLALAREHKGELLAALSDPEAVAALRAHLLAICRSHALPERLVANLPDAELEGCELLSPEGLVRWVQVLGENERMRKGIAPPGWTQASYCHHCGPVKLWAGAPLHVIGCPWCHVRKAAGQVPRPAVTCATCKHMRRMPQTSPAGMQSCKDGHGMHYAHAEHVCDDWRPAISTVENRERLP